MLYLLVKSAVRRKIIGLFAINHTQELYARQVAREIDESPHAVGLELAALVKGGLLVRTEKSGRTFFRWNAAYPYAEMLRQVVQKMRHEQNPEIRALADVGWRQILQHELDQAVKRLVDEYQPEKIIVFGSMATGQVHEDSDVDLFVIKQTSRRPIDRLKDVARFLSRKIGIDCVVWTPQEVTEATMTNSFLRNEILTKGKVVYDKVA